VAAWRDRPIVLSGGTGGLGSATARLLAAEGARLVLGYHSHHDRAALLAADCPGSTLCPADIRDPAGRAALLDAAPGLYGLVIFTGDPARGVSDEVLRQSVETNYLGPIQLARAAADRLRAASTPGAIVLLASMQAVYPFENSTAYAAAKAALVHAARVLAKECGGPPNIRVNVVAPGVTTGGMAEASVRAGKYDRFLERGVIPRWGHPDDIARAVRFFLEPDNYITGQVLAVDGGMTLRRDLA